MTEPRELVHLGFRRYQPHPALTPWVQCYWSVENISSTSCVEHIYPDGGSSLVFNQAAQGFDVATFAAHQAPQRITVEKKLFGIRFCPTGAHQLLDLPMQELAGERPAQAFLLLPHLMELSNRMMEETTLKQIKLVNNWLLARASNSSCGKGFGEKLAASLASQRCSIHTLASELGFSRRSAERLVRQQTGSTLGQLQAWRRVKQARQLIKLKRKRDLTDIGLSCGYYDQSHFIREFKKITTFTPMEYRKRQEMRITNGEMEIPAPRHWLEVKLQTFMANL